jgi:putative multiple sugar transport system ATP-binding protein
MFDGEERRFGDINDSEAHLGIIIIHQELALVPLLSIAENIFLGNEVAASYGVIDWQYGAQAHPASCCRRSACQGIADTLITDIGVGKQQLVEIAKALSKKVRLLILDEPTAKPQREGQRDALLAAAGVSRSGHDLDPHLAQAQRNPRRSPTRSPCCATAAPWRRLTVTCGTGRAKTDIIASMVGRDHGRSLPEARSEDRRGDFRSRELVGASPAASRTALGQECVFKVSAGEVVGIAGLMGAGRTEFAMSLFGRVPGAHNISGEARINGQCRTISTVARAIKAGLAYVTEDRKKLGLVLGETSFRAT